MRCFRRSQMHWGSRYLEWIFLERRDDDDDCAFCLLARCLCFPGHPLLCPPPSTASALAFWSRHNAHLHFLFPFVALPLCPRNIGLFRLSLVHDFSSRSPAPLSLLFSLFPPLVPLIYLLSRLQLHLSCMVASPPFLPRSFTPGS